MQSFKNEVKSWEMQLLKVTYQMKMPLVSNPVPDSCQSESKLLLFQSIKEQGQDRLMKPSAHCGRPSILSQVEFYCLLDPHILEAIRKVQAKAIKQSIRYEIVPYAIEYNGNLVTFSTKEERDLFFAQLCFDPVEPSALDLEDSSLPSLEAKVNRMKTKEK